MKKIIMCCFLFFVLCSPAFANNNVIYPGHPIEWNKDEITKYTVMTLNVFLSDKAPFTGPEEASMMITCHMAAALQILRNEGIIYSYEVILLQNDNDEVNFNVKVTPDVGGKAFTLKFRLGRTNDNIKIVAEKKPK